MEGAGAGVCPNMPPVGACVCPKTPAEEVAGAEPKRPPGLAGEGAPNKPPVAEVEKINHVCSYLIMTANDLTWRRLEQ